MELVCKLRNLLQANCAIIFLFYLDLILHACGSFEILNYATKQG